MKNNKTNYEKEVWFSLMLVVPVIILSKIGNNWTDDSSIKILFGVVGSLLGGIIGGLNYFIFKDKNRIIKSISTFIVTFFCGLLIYFLSTPNLSDDEIINQNWITQKIGKIEFDNPEKLIKDNIEIPDSLEWFYDELEMYSVEKNYRITTFLKSKLFIDTINVEELYLGLLSGMLGNINVKLDNVSFEPFETFENEVSTMFSFKIKNEIVNGYGYMLKQGKTIESIWLFPINKGFSKEYIETFEFLIIPDLQ